MLSPALRHKQKCLAIAAQKKGEQATLVGSTPVMIDAPDSHDRATLLAALDQDLERLSAVASVEAKAEMKKNELLPKYMPHVNGYLNSGARYPNAVLVRCAIWSIDAGDMEQGMALVEACIDQQQLLPDYFKRDIVTYFTESIADWAEAQLTSGDSGSPYIDLVCEHLSEQRWLTTNVIARGKAFKVAGLTAEARGDDRSALAYYHQAQDENDRAGCKGRIKKLQEKLGLAQ